MNIQPPFLAAISARSFGNPISISRSRSEVDILFAVSGAVLVEFGDCGAAWWSTGICRVIRLMKIPEG
jgi:hypothetical protein